MHKWFYLKVSQANFIYKHFRTATAEHIEMHFTQLKYINLKT